MKKIFSYFLLVFLVVSCSDNIASAGGKGSNSKPTKPENSVISKFAPDEPVSSFSGLEYIDDSGHYVKFNKDGNVEVLVAVGCNSDLFPYSSIKLLGDRYYQLRDPYIDAQHHDEYTITFDEDYNGLTLVFGDPNKNKVHFKLKV